MARIGERRVGCGVLVKKLGERNHFEDLCVDGRIILK